jgi:PST family polysaccharide transporter
VATPGLGGLALVADDALPLVLGERWRPAVLPFQLLCPVGVLMIVNAALQQTFGALGRPDVTMKFNGACALVLPAGFFLGGSMVGLVGICAAWLVLYPFLLVVLLRWTRDIAGITVTAILRSQCPVLLGTAFMAGCVLLARLALGAEGPAGVRVLVAVGAGVASYAAWMLLTARRTVLADLRLVWGELRGG